MDTKTLELTEQQANVIFYALGRCITEGSPRVAPEKPFTVNDSLALIQTLEVVQAIIKKEEPKAEVVEKK